MLSFFKKRKENNLPLRNWQIPVDASYRLINNGDSIQFVNADQSHILYFSVLTFTGKSLLPGEISTKVQPTLTRTDAGWQFKGTRQEGNELLVCVFSFINENDDVLMQELFKNIVYVGK